MLLNDLTDEESIYLERAYASAPDLINREAISLICGIGERKARACLKAWKHFGYVKTYTHSSGRYGLRSQNLWTDKTKNLFERSKASHIRKQVVFQPGTYRPGDSVPTQVSTYTKLSKCKYFKNHERGKPSRDEEDYEVKKMPDPFLSDSSAPSLSDFEREQADERQRVRLEQQREKQAERARRFERKNLESATKKRASRYKKTNRADWTARDIAFEFADRLASFHIESWEVVKTQFIPALVDARLRYNTTGDLEYLMVLKYVEIVDIKQFKTGDALWKNFIYRFGQIADIVRAQYSTPEEIEENNKIVESSRRKLRESILALEEEQKNV